jgi:hypothetical protein
MMLLLLLAHTRGLALAGLLNTRGTSLAPCTLVAAPGKPATSLCRLRTSSSTRGTALACTLANHLATPDLAAAEQFLMSRQAMPSITTFITFLYD